MEELKNQEKKELIFISVLPDDTHFMWETEVQINSLKKYNLSNKLKVLVYWRSNEIKQTINLHWLVLKKKYPEVEFLFYKGDDEELPPSILQNVYVSVLRPYCLKQYWKTHPEVQEKTVFYMDSDVIFTQVPKIDSFIEDEVCYLSDTKSYLGVNYMQNKAKEVGLEPNHFINIAADIVGIDPQIIIDNDEGCGGAQYILKNIPIGFWEKVEKDCLMIKQRFAFENQRYFVEKGIERGLSTEDAGIQSWCADMWAVLYNLYYFDKKVKAPKELDFAWATDNIEKAQVTSILHNTGVGGSNNSYLFDKTRYRAGREYVDKWPYEENLDYVNKDYCSYLYVKEIKDTYKNELQAQEQTL